jgi:hypothetical protein
MDKSGPGHGLAGGILRLIFPLDDLMAAHVSQWRGVAFKIDGL